MPMYSVFVHETYVAHFLVEANNAEEAREYYYEGTIISNDDLVSATIDSVELWGEEA